MKEVGIPREKVLGMNGTQQERILGDGALGEIERSLRAKLRSHRLSQPFIDRCAEDALQKGVIEYLRARKAGAEIRDPGGFVVQAAFRRAIDELRREARRADGAAVEALLASGRRAAPAAEEVALEEMSAAELHAAIDELPAEERQALSLHYFEELTNRRAAEILYCSERTFRRRLGSALTHLSQAIGAPAPEPGSQLALEAGVASWVSLSGARVLISSHPLSLFSGAIETAAQFVARLTDRLRDPAARLSSGGTSEQLGAIVSGPAGKVIGGCAGAAIVCVLSGVVVSNVELGGHDSPAPRRAPPPRRHVSAAPDRVLARPHPSAQPAPSTRASEPGADSVSTERNSQQLAQRRAARHQQRSVDRREAEERQLEEQMSGITRAAQEADVESAPSASAVSPVEPVTNESPAPSAPPPPPATTEERQTEKQFRGPLAR